jgi:yeast amino acid transporter
MPLTYILPRTSINIAMFAFIGVEILVVTAGEAKDARRDLPVATRRMYLITIFLYVVSAIIVSSNVGYDDPQLEPYNGVPKTVSSSNSPFIIAIRNSNLAAKSHFEAAYKAFFFVSAATTAWAHVSHPRSLAVCSD